MRARALHTHEARNSSCLCAVSVWYSAYLKAAGACGAPRGVCQTQRSRFYLRGMDKHLLHARREKLGAGGQHNQQNTQESELRFCESGSLRQAREETGHFQNDIFIMLFCVSRIWFLNSQSAPGALPSVRLKSLKTNSYPSEAPEFMGLFFDPNPPAHRHVTRFATMLTRSWLRWAQSGTL